MQGIISRQVSSWTAKGVFPLIARRFARHQAYDAGFDQDELAEARSWRASFQPSSIPKGNTSFSRSQGAGGQHSRTETKATTTWPVSQLMGILPKLLHPSIRSSKYYTKTTDSITMQAQAHRSRSANMEDNRQKLYQEIQEIYQKVVPGESSPDKARKYEALKKTATEARIRLKKQQSSKKTSRKGGFD
ncbi:meiotically up-regulated gene 82 protein [Naviculisporaceae sp. PSN 640]